nr:MAG TPA: hypothetical protein [Bacteriophage sp.]
MTWVKVSRNQSRLQLLFIRCKGSLRVALLFSALYK